MKRRKKGKRNERILIVIIVFAVLFAGFILFSAVKPLFFAQGDRTSEQGEVKKSRLSLTSFDRELARKMMDKDNDGKCDSCGMPVEICMDSGQLQCNMDSKSTIGILDSQHIHADWKMYINGEALDFTGKDHMTRMRSGSSVSSFMHVDSGAPAPEKTGDILHMHAKGVPLWIFFDSVELELPDGTKAYVNGKEIIDWKNYVFNDLDKILMTDGTGDLKEQLNSITNFAGAH